MLRKLLILLLVNSNFCYSQSKQDSSAYDYLVNVWNTNAVRDSFVFSLDSNSIDLYKVSFPEGKSRLRMKYGYVHDISGIYCFQIISSDLEKVLYDFNRQEPSNGYPKHTFFKLRYVYDGSTFYCYRTHEMLSGFGKEYPFFLESIVDYSFQGFNMPFVIKDEVYYTR